MHTLFLLNPTAGKTDCTQQLPQQINAAAARAGLAPEEYTIRITTHAGHARELARAAAAGAQRCAFSRRAATAPSTRPSPGPMALQAPPWAACPMAAAMTSCARLGRGRSFWTWMPNWRAGRCPST